MPSKKSESKSKKLGKSPQVTDAPKSDSIYKLVQRQMDDATASFRKSIAESRFGESSALPMTATASESGCAASYGTITESPGYIAEDRALHTSEGVTSVIATLQSLEETLPGIVHAANAGSGLCGLRATPFRTTAAVGNAIGMLQEYRRRIDLEVRLRDDEQGKRTHRMAYGDGIRAGIDKEKARAKEAKRGRKH